jgi:hypothetical protein
MEFKIAMKYHFPFTGNKNIEQLLKFSEAYHPLDYLTFVIIDYLSEYKDGIQGPQQHVVERLISWIEREILGKVKNFKELQALLYAQNVTADDQFYTSKNIRELIEVSVPYSAKGIEVLIENMIPYRYYEVLSGDEIENIRKSTIKVYKAAINEAFSKALDKPSLTPTQIYEMDESKIPEYKQEDVVTPWLQGSEYERI